MPVADEVFRLQNGRGPEGDFFRSFATLNLNNGDTKQGTWIATSSGQLLGAVNSRSAGEIGTLMRSSLAKYRQMPKAQRVRTAPVDARASDRNETRYPQGGMVLRSTSRDLPGAPKGSAWMATAWNTDVCWFTAEEMRQLMPTAARKGAKLEVPAPLIRRIVRFNLVDNVRGQTWAFEDAQVEKAALAVEVTGVEKGVVQLRITGEARAVAKGRWSVRGHDDPRPTDQERGVDMKLLGRAAWDTKKDRFTSFEIVAAGTRWGGTQYNRRENDLAVQPMGVVLQLADDKDRVAPSAFYQYGWR